MKKKILLGLMPLLMLLMAAVCTSCNGCNFITLRLPVGPVDCHPQWVVGGVYDPLFIDALTGAVSDSNPAFPRP